MSKVDLTPAKLACLKDAAESINPIYRNWFLNDYKRWVETYDNGDAIIVCHPEQIQPALGFIAEADPATVLALVYEIDLLKKRLSWFPAHIKEKIDLAILAHTGGMADPCKEHCGCDDSVGYYCEYCAVYDALISCKQATESEAGQ